MKTHAEVAATVHPRPVKKRPAMNMPRFEVENAEMRAPVLQLECALRRSVGDPREYDIPAQHGPSSSDEIGQGGSREESDDVSDSVHSEHQTGLGGRSFEAKVTLEGCHRVDRGHYGPIKTFCQPWCLSHLPTIITRAHATDEGVENEESHALRKDRWTGISIMCEL